MTIPEIVFLQRSCVLTQFEIHVFSDENASGQLDDGKAGREPISSDVAAELSEQC
jgi:hypothetical protein